MPHAAAPGMAQNLESLRRRVPAVSVSALSEIIHEIETHGLPANHNRGAFRRARDQVCDAMTPYGKVVQPLALIPHVAGAHVEVAHPLALLWFMFSSCESWRELIKSKHANHPSSPTHPWKLILYTDEVVPGNALATQPKRKSQCVYASFYELGEEVLCRESAWLTLCVVRSSTCRGADGGIAQLVGALLKLMFPLLTDVGIFLCGGDDTENIRLHARLSTIVQDMHACTPWPCCISLVVLHVIHA